MYPICVFLYGIMLECLIFKTAKSSLIFKKRLLNDNKFWFGIKN